MSQDNPYEDVSRAAAYADLAFENTYHLAYRDLPALFARYGVHGPALDYGCGTGRSTRFLHELGLAAIGVDISEPMVSQARKIDPTGTYKVIGPGDLREFPDDAFDTVLSVMPFDSVPTMREKVDTLNEMSRVLKPDGFKVLVAAAPAIYTHEWASFSSSDFPDNRKVKSGDKVHVIITDSGDRRAVEDVFWTEEAYEDTFRQTTLELMATHRPIARSEDEYQCEWRSETTHAPWNIFVLRNRKRDGRV